MGCRCGWGCRGSGGTVDCGNKVGWIAEDNREASSVDNSIAILALSAQSVGVPTLAVLVNHFAARISQIIPVCTADALSIRKTDAIWVRISVRCGGR